MFYTLRARFTLAMALVALVAVIAVSVLAVNSVAGLFSSVMVGQRMGRQSQWAALLGSFYETNGGWAGAQDALAPSSSRGRGPGAMMGWRMQMPDWVRLASPDGTVLADSQGGAVGGKLTSAEVAAASPVIVGDNLVGLVSLGTGAGAQLASIEEKFRQAVIRSTALAGVAAVLLAVGLGAALCRSFTVNLRRLSEAAAEYGKGGLEHRVTVSSRDEVGALAESFNTMAGNLGRMDNARKSLVADVAHELRTPLFILGGNLESIQAGVTEPTPEVVAALQDEVLRMSRLVSDLQNLSLAEAGKLPLHVTEVAPTELLTAVEAAVAPEAENNGVKLSVCATDAFPKVALDRDRITQVLLNLIGNAFKFTPAGGLITLSAKINGNRVVFTVADTGPGIPSEHIPFVFDRFYRAEQSRSRAEGGMGLGLAIAKGYVEAHGGQIWVDSVPAKGTTFSFSLPLTDISKTPNRTNDYGNNLPPSRV